jgi:hypothetical protein
MDEIKLETSTLCGQIFLVRKCIYGVINAQNKCPICREKLSLKNVVMYVWCD